MRFEHDVSQDTFQVECIAGDNSSDAVTDNWPTCKPGKRPCTYDVCKQFCMIEKSLSTCTEMRFNVCTWFGEISSCFCLTVLPDLQRINLIYVEGFR